MLIGSKKLLKSILRNIVYLQTDIKHIEINQHAMLKKIEVIESNCDNIKNSSNGNIDEIPEYQLPIDNLNDLNAMENKIKENLHLKN